MGGKSTTESKPMNHVSSYAGLEAIFIPLLPTFLLFACMNSDRCPIMVQPHSSKAMINASINVLQMSRLHEKINHPLGNKILGQSWHEPKILPEFSGLNLEVRANVKFKFVLI